MRKCVIFYYIMSSILSPTPQPLESIPFIERNAKLSQRQMDNHYALDRLSDTIKSMQLDTLLNEQAQQLINLNLQQHHSN